VFVDPFACTIPDPDHGADEERWVTVREASTGILTGSACASSRRAYRPQGYCILLRGTVLPCRAATSVPVIPAKRAGLLPASESRNPVSKTVRAFTSAVDYWVPARASPVEAGSLGRDDSPYAIALRPTRQRGAAIPRGRHAMSSDDMRDEYDFSKAARGKFHRPNASLAPPIHLEPEVLAFLTARAQMCGVTLNELVNALLKKGIELIEAAE
jgi:hypothetical protein